MYWGYSLLMLLELLTSSSSLLMLLGLFSRFMLRTIQKLGEAKTKYWRNGFIINASDGLGMV
jgi:hypothetical protein